MTATAAYIVPRALFRSPPPPPSSDEHRAPSPTPVVWVLVPSLGIDFVVCFYLCRPLFRAVRQFVSRIAFALCSFRTDG